MSPERIAELRAAAKATGKDQRLFLGRTIEELLDALDRAQAALREIIVAADKAAADPAESYEEASSGGNLCDAWGAGIDQGYIGGLDEAAAIARRGLEG